MATITNPFMKRWQCAVWASPQLLWPIPSKGVALVSWKTKSSGTTAVPTPNSWRQDWLSWIKTMRNAFIDELVCQAAIHPNIALVVGDLGYSVVEPFADRFPERFINAGVAEQNMTGLAAG